jgi:hypothetical protein
MLESAVIATAGGLLASSILSRSGISFLSLYDIGGTQ